MNMLATRREELEKEVLKRAREVRDYIIENAPNKRTIKLGHINEENKKMEYWLKNEDGLLKGVLDSFELVKYEDKIKEKIDEMNEGIIKEMRGVLDGD